LGLSVCVLMALEGFLFSATSCALNGPENLRFQAVSKSFVLTELMVLNQPLGAHGVGGQDIDDLLRSGWIG
jgi:hypothetical protein